MKVLDILRDRYSVRQFTSQPVAKEAIDTILEAARLAPTAKNSQPFRLYVLTGDAINDAVGRMTRCQFGAPLVIVMTKVVKESWVREDGYISADMDAGIVGTHILLQAHHLGLGGCWIGVLNPLEVKRQLGLVEEEPVSLFAIGHIPEGVSPFPRHYERKSLEDLVRYVEVE